MIDGSNWKSYSTMHFFTVTTKKNLSSLIAGIDQHKILHKYLEYIVICPASDVSEFSHHFATYFNVKIRCEDDILSKDRFIQIGKELSLSLHKDEINNKRMGWYYQQSLKLAYALMNKHARTVMWDADSIPIDEIQFFENNCSVAYGSLIEYQCKYFNTIANIFDFINPIMAYTIQFFTLTELESKYLEENLNIYIKRNRYEPYGEWIARVLLTAVIRNNEYLSIFNQSYISEQEIVGISNSNINQTRQYPIRHFRPGRCWISNKRRLAILRMLRYRYYTIETYYMSPNKYVDILYFWTFLAFDTLRQLASPILIKYAIRSRKCK